MSNPRRSGLEVAYLLLAVAGFLLPGVPMLQESFATGNVLFWTQPARTVAELFATRTSTAFALDLFAAVIVAAVWIAVEARRLDLRGAWRFYVLLALFGLGGTLPLFLWSRERHLAKDAIALPRRQGRSDSHAE